MKRVLLLTILLLALASPAMAQTSTYPPSPSTSTPPPVCVNPPCDTADTGSNVGWIVVGVIVLGVLGSALYLRNRK